MAVPDPCVSRRGFSRRGPRSARLRGDGRAEGSEFVHDSAYRRLGCWMHWERRSPCFLSPTTRAPLLAGTSACSAPNALRPLLEFLFPICLLCLSLTPAKSSRSNSEKASTKTGFRSQVEQRETLPKQERR